MGLMQAILFTNNNTCTWLAGSMAYQTYWTSALQAQLVAVKSTLLWRRTWRGTICRRDSRACSYAVTAGRRKRAIMIDADRRRNCNYKVQNCNVFSRDLQLASWKLWQHVLLLVLIGQWTDTSEEEDDDDPRRSKLLQTALWEPSAKLSA